MRLTLSGRRVAYVAGYGLVPPQPTVIVRLEDDREQVIGPGHSPRWPFEDALVYGPQDDGPLMSANVAGRWQAVPTTMPSGNVITAAAGKVAVSRTDPRRILTSWRGTMPDAVEPSLSDGGDWLAMLWPDDPKEGVSTLVVERAADGGRRIGYTGAPALPRFGSRTLCWEDAGRVFGIADVANPTSLVVDLTLEGWRCSTPIPVWVPARGELYVGLVRDKGASGELVLREWAAPNILVLGESAGSGFEWDIRPVEGTRDLRAVWRTPEGALFSRGVSLDLPRVPSQPPVPTDVPVEWWPLMTGPQIDLWPLVLASANAVSPDGRTAYLSKSDTDPLRAEWWRLSDDGHNIQHLEDRTRVDGIDPGWFMCDPFLAPWRVVSGQRWRNVTEMFDRATGRWEPYTIDVVARVAKAGTIRGEPITVRLDIDNRHPPDATGRRPGRVEWFWFTHRWRRWTDLWDDPTVPGDALSIVIGQDGIPRDFISDPPTPKAYVACPRPDPLPPPNPSPLPDPLPDPEPPPMPIRLPNDDQMRNCQARIHVEGFLGHLQRPGGIFDTAESSQIVNPARTEADGSIIEIDDRALSVWTGRYVQYFVADTSADPHEPSIRRVLRDIYHSDEAKRKRGEPILPPPPPPSDAPRMAGPLRLQDGGVADDTGLILPVLCHAGDAFAAWIADPAFVEAELDVIASHYMGIRFWHTLEWRDHPKLGTALAGPLFQSDYFDRLATFLDRLRARGLVAHLAGGSLFPSTIGPDADGFARHLGQAVQAVGPSVVCLFEGTNESRDTAPGWDAARLARYVQAFKSECPSVLCALSAYTGHEDARVTNDYSRPPADVAVYHQLRLGSLAELMQHAFSYSYIGTEYPDRPSVAVEKSVIWNGEGTGPGKLVSAHEGQAWMTDSTMAAWAGLALTMRQPFNFFSGPGVRLASEPIASMPGFTSVPAVARLLPRDVMSRRWQIFHGGERWADRRVFAADGDTRAAHALCDDGRFVCWLYDGDGQCPQVRGTVETTHPFDDGRVWLVTGRV